MDLGFINIRPEFIIMFLCFIPAIVVHEVAHGYVAFRLGDPTAKSKGRITLNPLAHVDPFGTVILPLVLMVSGSPVFGYAKPVPYNPGYFKNIRQGEFLTGIAGPASNIIMALLSAGFGRIIMLVLPAGSEVGYWVVFVCYLFTMVNLCLAFFNLIPLPPLDGSSIIALFLPDQALRQYYRIQRFALPILLIVIFILPMITGVNILGIYINATAVNLSQFLFS